MNSLKKNTMMIMIMMMMMMVMMLMMLITVMMMMDDDSKHQTNSVHRDRSLKPRHTGDDHLLTRHQI